jgi:uncharacterized protein
MKHSRRSVLKAVAVVPASIAGRAWGQRSPVSADHGRPPAAADGAFGARDVRLLPGSPFYDRQELHRTKTLASYEPDKLLFPYRALAGLPQADGVESGYAGWDSGFIRGHMTGHYLSAASRMAAATGDGVFRDRANYIVGELAKCQEALKQDGYLAAFPPEVFDWLEGKLEKPPRGVVVPYYTVHKIMAGLLDAHHYLGNAQALEVTEKMAVYFEKRLAGLSAEQIERAFRTDGSRNPQNEFGSMSDALIDLYKVTKDARHMDAARIFNRPWFVGTLARGEDRLAELHANTHIQQAYGLANCANTYRDPEELKASENFWRIVVQKHSFANGGNSFKEWFDKPGVEVGASIDGGSQLPATTCETCNTHNMLKLAARLFERKPTAEHGGYYERALYNHVLASVAPDSGEMTYFMPLRGGFRTYMDGTFCCSGTGIENTPRYNEGIYYRVGDALWVNLYVPSELDWRRAGMVIRQQGDIIKGEPVRLTVVKAGADAVTLNFRIPAWISKPATLAVNGKVEEPAAKASTFVSLRRQWSAGDVITLMLPASLRIERAEDDPSMVSIFFGPVLLAGALGRDNMPDDFGDKDAYLKTPPAAVPDIVSDSMNPTDWMQPISGERPAFTAHNAGPANGVVFRPVYEVHHERYSVYWRVRKG